MPDSLLTQLLDFGGIGLFAGFLIWQHLKLTARQEKMVEQFQLSLDKLTDKYEAELDKVRERYDTVIERYESKHDATFEKVVTVLDDLDKTLNKVDTNITEAVGEMRIFGGELRGWSNIKNE